MTNTFLRHPLGELVVTYALHLQLVGKCVVDFLFAIIEHFLLALPVRCHKQILVKIRVFQLGVGHFKHKFLGESEIAHQPLLVAETRVITLSCGIKILAVYSFVLSQSTHVTDGRMGGRTDRWTELRSQDHASIAASRGNKTSKSNIMIMSLPCQDSPVD